MKKFLSLALALIMTLSLVTISAGATEYKDFTDKDEIQYEEAVAVLNKLGIITGYSEGDFRPEGELTRGAAAKIIVSLLIGPENAEALPTTGNPYPDVPAGNVFAGYIGFCKTSGIISGYGDGTFRPNGTLTGYAFSKMLLGALGYKDQFEGLSGDGWTMNVANLGNKAGLFNRIDFKGGDTVNRETACLLALNTLKATMVEYTGGMNITTDAGSMVVNPTRTYVISNQDYATHISNRKAGNTDSVGNAGSSNTHYTVEFGEEHFRDLRMDREESNSDQFGRPSNVWSYKKATIGTYPIEPDYTYTTQVIHAVEGTTDASKVRALGLSGLDTVSDDLTTRGQTTTLWLNGFADSLPNNKVAEIADYTDNGTLVEVYVSDEEADFITDVVVIKTQLMEVKRVGSDYVSLDKHDVDGDDDSKTGADPIYGYNQKPIERSVHDVEVDDECYSILKDLKAGDLVAIVPVTEDNIDFEVAEAYVPETVTGALTRVDTYGTASKDRNAVKVTVGGTEYNIALWNKDLYSIDGDTIRVTNKDVTLYLDKYGNALKAKDVGDTSNWMVIKNYTQGLVNGNIVTYANGWDISGETLSLNIGSGSAARNIEDAYLPGDLVYYSNNTNSNVAEWKLSMGADTMNTDTPAADTAAARTDGVFRVWSGKAITPADADYSIKASNTSIRLEGFTAAAEGTDAYDRVSIDTGIKFIYVNIDPTDKEVDSIEFVNGVKDTTIGEINGNNSNSDHSFAQACVSLKDKKDGVPVSPDRVTKDSAVKAVVIKRESNDASASNLLYISNYHGSATLYDNDRRPVYGYEAVILGNGGKVVDDDAVVYSYRALAIGDFARYTKVAAPEGVTGVDDNFYELRGYGTGITNSDNMASTWGRSAAVATTALVLCEPADKYLVRTSGTYDTALSTNTLSTPEIHKTWGVDQYNLSNGDNANDLLNLRGADWVDLREDVSNRNGVTRIEDIDDLKDYLDKNKTKQVNVSILFNDNTDSDDFRKVYLVVVNSTSAKTGGGTDTPQPSGETWKLTLTGSWDAATKVWNEAGDKEYEAASSTTTINGTVKVYEIPKGETVKIQSNSLTDGKYTVNGEHLTVSSSIVSVTMDADKTLNADTDFAASAQTYTITVEKGITIKEFQNGSGVKIAAEPFDTATDAAGNTVYTLKTSSNVVYARVKTTDTEYAYITVNEGQASMPVKAAANNAITNDGGGNIAAANTSDQEIMLISGTDQWIYGATKVTFSGVNQQCFGYDGGNAGQHVIHPGSALKVSISMEDDGVSAAIAQEGTTAVNVAADRIHNGYVIGNKETTIKGAFTVTLKNVEATLPSGEKATDKFYVAANQNPGVSYAVATGSGTEVIALTDSNVHHGTDYSSGGTISTDTVVTAASKITAVSSGKVYYTNVHGDKVELDDTDCATNFFEVGFTVTLEGADTTNGYSLSAAEDVSGDDVTLKESTPSGSGKTAKAFYTVGTEDITVTES